MAIQLTINDQLHHLDVAPDTPLLWVIRDQLELTGTKFGCGVASCGACTVHLNGTPIRSCVTPISVAAGGEIRTVEGLEGSGDPIAEAVQQAWGEKDVVQCGYCQSGQIMSAVGLLKETPNPSDEQIDSYMSGNVCRCATYVRVKDAIKTASDKLEG
ncbi:(2Fe-2S)-binding protein [Motiliproteus coralliicola]|uniref:(2Fe-2S)-binding protein n=1 Tax=Motiliproteus coralliicola TaxID=2283196 RepID=A0A369WFT0_9GAMM|nr:(2Fe-2S)-binding protein [Motiliproteus coralliicola]RDE19524.1 (2Fe-2S)-binding protein [Motiliproteus coralliicola]